MISWYLKFDTINIGQNSPDRHAGLFLAAFREHDNDLVPTVTGCNVAFPGIPGDRTPGMPDEFRAAR
jgi:hypothetical protein